MARIAMLLRDSVASLESWVDLLCARPFNQVRDDAHPNRMHVVMHAKMFAAMLPKGLAEGYTLRMDNYWPPSPAIPPATPSANNNPLHQSSQSSRQLA
jgi:hypothetical protein